MFVIYRNNFINLNHSKRIKKQHEAAQVDRLLCAQQWLIFSVYSPRRQFVCIATRFTYNLSARHAFAAR
jgi:hypothetical protein